MRRYLNQILVSVLLILIAFCILSWAVLARRSIPLINGYRCYIDDMVCISLNLDVDGVEQARVDRVVRSGNKWYVGPTVNGYCVYSRIITGHVIDKECNNPRYKHEPGNPQTPGYFIIDTHTDRIFRGLSKHEWLNRLRSFGVNSEPKLFKPSPFDRFLGRNKPQ